MQTHALIDLRSEDLSKAAIEQVLASVVVATEAGRLLATDVRLFLSEAHREALADALDDEWQVSSPTNVIEAANHAMLGAAIAGAQWFVSVGVAIPDEECFLALESVLATDPYFGFAFPRFARVGEDGCLKLSENLGDPGLNVMPMPDLASRPDYYLVADHLKPAMLASLQVVRDFEALSGGYETLASALRDWIARSRRVGFRCVVSNRSIARVEAANAKLELEGTPADEKKLKETFPEIEALEAQWSADGLHEWEALRGRACSPNTSIRNTLLIDLSDLGAVYNGTSEAVIALLSGLSGIHGDWKVDLLVAPNVADFHGLDRIARNFRPVWPEPDTRYTAVFRPIQPWSLRQIERLHGLGLFVFVMMFDTILGDSSLRPDLRLDTVWRTLARVADGLFYISRFTRDRFRTRFPVADSVEEKVTLLSTNPADYCAEPRRGKGNFIFLVGNDLPHKWIQPTIRDLADVFPGEKFKTLGYSDPTIRQLEGVDSGHASASAVTELYRDARLIIYPSLYEGFGFPVVRGLSFGRTVIARKSALLEEVAAHYRGPGRLLGYDTRSELVESVARCLKGMDVEEMPLGKLSPESSSPRSQVEFAADVLSAIERRVADPNSSLWARRQQIFEVSSAYAAHPVG